MFSRRIDCLELFLLILNFLTIILILGAFTNYNNYINEKTKIHKLQERPIIIITPEGGTTLTNNNIEEKNKTFII